MLNEGSKNAHSDKITIEVIYALPHEQALISVLMDSSCTVEQAIIASEILDKHPQLKLEEVKIGIFSKMCKLTDTLHDFDRIEIYRPLLIDPKEARLKRADKTRS